MIRQLYQELKQGDIHPVYLFYGSETFLMDEACEEIRNQVLPEENRDWDETIMDLEEVPVQALVQEVETPSFFGERRVVTGRNAWFLTGARTKEKVPHQPDELIRYVQQPMESNILILTVPSDKLDARKKVVKELRKKVREVVFQPLEAKELTAWVSKRLKQTGVDVHPRSGEQLIHRVGGDLRLLNQEIGKLASFAGTGGSITPEVVEELVPRTLEQDVFKLVDQVSRRQIGAALSIYYDLLSNREEPIRILSLIIRQFRIMLQVKVLARQGRSEREIASLLKVHPYPVKLASRQGKAYPESLLRQLLSRSIEADQEIKSGRIEKTLAVEKLLLSVGTV